MKSPRTWNRREFNVTPNGYFTVLKPAAWFSASRLPAGFRYLIGQRSAKPVPSATSASKPIRHDAMETALRLQVLEPVAHDHSLIRPTLIVLTAATVTAILLCWIILPR